MTKQYIYQQLEQDLQEYGLTHKQAKIYLASLQLGPASVQSIARKAEVERTNTYDALEGLINHHLMSITPMGKKHLYVAEPPEMIKRLLQEKEEKLKVILPELRSLNNSSENKPRIRYYPGEQGYMTVYEDTLTTSTKQLFGLYSNKAIIEVLGKSYIDDMVERRVKAGIFLRTIHPRAHDMPGLWGTSKTHMRDVRLAPQDMDLPIVSFVYDNKVIILSSKKETFGLIIESQDIATAQASFFEALWQISTPAPELK